MPKDNNDECLKDINIEDIFERKIEIGAVIQFSLLQRIIEEFIKKQKIMNDKINALENKIESINKGMLEVNYNTLSLKLSSSNSDDKTKDNQDKIIRDINTINESEMFITPPSEKNLDFKQSSSSKEIKSNLKEEKEKKNKKFNNIDNDEKNKDLSHRLGKVETVVKKIISISNDNKNNIILHNTTINEILENMNKLQSKMGENNLLSSIINLNEQFGNDELMTLIKEVDKKMNVKMNELESLNKNNEQKIIIHKKEIIDLQNSTKANALSSKNIKDNINKNLNDFNLYKNNNEKELKDIKNIFDNKINDVKNELLKNLDEQNKKLSDMIIEQSNVIKKYHSNIDPQTLSSISNEKINNLSIELKHYFTKSITESEKNFKSHINNLGIEKIKSDLIQLNDELNNRLTKNDLEPYDKKNDEINKQFNEVNKKINQVNIKIEDNVNSISTINSEIAKNKQTIDFLINQNIKSYQPGLGNNKKMNNEELKNFVKKDMFNEEMKLISKKLDSLLEYENVNNTNIEIIGKKLEEYATDNDLKNLEHYLFNVIEEFKNLTNKKFLEKKDGLKSFKYFELQIKTIIDNINNNSLQPIQGGDNWLIAKKPINNYICASCESYIGDLKNNSKNNNYLPWNRLSPTEKNKYRMGHGFSKMLQLINDDLMKNAGSIKDDLSLKIEDTQNVKSLIDNKILPKLKSPKDLKKKFLSSNDKIKNKEIKDNELDISQINLSMNNIITSKPNNTNDSINDHNLSPNITNNKKKDGKCKEK